MPLDIYLDIETLPADAHPGVIFGYAPGWTPPLYEAPPFIEPERKRPPSNWKDAQKIAEFEASEDVRHATAVIDATRDYYAAIEVARHRLEEASRAAAWATWAGGSLSPMAGRILCVGYAIGDQPAQVITGTEAEQLRELARIFDLAYVESRGQVRVIGHNMNGFDGPFLALRAGKHRVRGIGPYVVSASGKPWEAMTLDTLSHWPCGKGRKLAGEGNLDAVAAFLDIDRSANPITGAQVLEAYVSGREADVIAHCCDDIETLRQVHRWMVAAGFCR